MERREEFWPRIENQMHTDNSNTISFSFIRVNLHFYLWLMLCVFVVSI